MNTAVTEDTHLVTAFSNLRYSSRRLRRWYNCFGNIRLCFWRSRSLMIHVSFGRSYAMPQLSCQLITYWLGVPMKPISEQKATWSGDLCSEPNQAGIVIIFTEKDEPCGKDRYRLWRDNTRCGLFDESATHCAFVWVQLWSFAMLTAELFAESPPETTTKVATIITENNMLFTLFIVSRMWLKNTSLHKKFNQKHSDYTRLLDPIEMNFCFRIKQFRWLNLKSSHRQRFLWNQRNTC